MSKNTIAGMLLENTGTHFLDSGGTSGRNWQRNQERDFECECATSLTFRWDYIEVTHNIYHWLKDRIEPAEEMQALFDEFEELEENTGKYWLELMESFPKWLEEHKEIETSGLYGDGEPMTVNTYNGECLLSQVLQYTYFETDEGAFYLLQIHGGADVRGGYTAPKVFQETGMTELALFDNARGTIYCKPPDVSDFEKQFADNVIERIKQNLKLAPKHQLNLFNWPTDERDEHYWTTDDGYHWYFEGTAGYSAGQQLEEYEITDDESLKGKGAIYRDDEGNGYCPHCASRLYASAF